MPAKSLVIKFDYECHTEFICTITSKRKHRAICKFCNATFTEMAGTMLNFYQHLERKHKEREVTVTLK